jgi:hypothetical protein
LIVILLLVVVGSVNIYYRHVHVGVPLTPGEQVSIWQIEAEITFSGRNTPATVSMTLPQDHRFDLIEEFTASPAYGVTVDRSAAMSKVVWSKRNAKGDQTLYYQGTYKARPGPDGVKILPEDSTLEVLEEPYQSATEGLLSDALDKSGNQTTLVAQILKLMNSNDQNMGMLRSRFSRTEIFVQLMKMAEIPVVSVRGLPLRNGRRNQSLIPLVRVQLDGKWSLKNVESREIGNDVPVLVWLEKEAALLEVEGGRNSDISFAISERRVSALQEANAFVGSKDANRPISLYHLPVAEQNLFKGILLLPLGALVVVFMRVIIGLSSSGTFMPILIAGAFIQTELLNGLIGFLTVVSVGLLIRGFLSHLNLLLVSRISAVVIVVIGLILTFTIFAFQLGLTNALTITFFPMVIMAWTIERMSILWEEEGAKEVMVQGFGSLMIAVLAYLIMDNSLARHFAFNFLGIHALIMAAILLMGQYTGYRLLELKRFTPLSK